MTRLFVCLCVGRGIRSRGLELADVVPAVALGATAAVVLAVVFVLR